MAEQKGLPMICFAASAGGHLEENLCLRSLRSSCPHFLITEEASGVEIDENEKVVLIPQMKRGDVALPILMAKAFMQVARAFRLKNPDCVVSTGALSTIPAMVLGHFFGAKVIYIESQARTSTLSLTGRFVYRFADLFIVQWSSLERMVPGSVYRGMLS